MTCAVWILSSHFIPLLATASFARHLVTRILHSLVVSAVMHHVLTHRKRHTLSCSYILYTQGNKAGVNAICLNCVYWCLELWEKSMNSWRILLERDWLTDWLTSWLTDWQTDKQGGDTISTARWQVRSRWVELRRVTRIAYQVTSVDHYNEQYLICILVGADRFPHTHFPLWPHLGTDLFKFCTAKPESHHLTLFASFF
jgi:hypothetical protein